MTPCTERLCIAAAVIACTLALPCLTALEVPAALLCRATELRAAAAARLETIAAGAAQSIEKSRVARVVTHLT
jgi:hypothetical protein